MQRGWVKLHRSILDNPIWKYDPTAWRLFEALLLLVDRNGEWTGGSYQLAYLTSINRSTLYKSLLRLKKAEMVTTSVTSKFTTYSCLNWDKYQGDDTQPKERPRNGQGTAKDTLTRIEEYKNIRKDKDIRQNVSADALPVLPSPSNSPLSPKAAETASAVQRVFAFYLTSFLSPTSKLTPNRLRLIKARLKDCGEEMLTEAIKRTAASPFHRGENNRGWKANIDFIIRSPEQVERLSQLSQVESTESRYA